MTANNLHLLHDPKLPPTFNSCRLRQGYNPDLAFVSQNISGMCNLTIYDTIPHSQHRPHGVTIKPIITPIEQPFRRCFNLRKVNWDDFMSKLGTNVDNLGPASWRKYDEFLKTVRSSTRRHIPCGCRTKYIPGLSSYSVKLLMEYQHLYNSDPFSDDTIEAGQIQCNQLEVTRQQQWEEMVANIDLTHNSKKGWQLLS